MYTTQSTRELNFHLLKDGTCGFAFPCDETGQVNLDTLSEHARNQYFYARALVGRVFHAPTVRAADLRHTPSTGLQRPRQHATS